MKMKMKSFSLLAAMLVLGLFVSAGPSPKPLKVIFDTDMGNDVDDALALDLLYKYVEDGRIDLLGITSNKEELASVEYIDIMNNFYGFPDIPIGRITDGANCDRVNSYVSVVSKDKRYKRSHKDYTKLPESVDLMRRLLAEAEDGSVAIVAVGFSTNLSRLLASKPDGYSALDGRELVRRKVKGLYMMAGDFTPKPIRPEYNIRIDRAAAQDVFRNWPTPVVTSPWEVGEEVLYPCESILNDFKYAVPHPMVEAYKVYKPMPYDRQTWDVTTVLYAVEPDAGYFGTSGPGRIVVTDGSQTLFEADPDGNRSYLTITPEQSRRVRDYFIRMITRVPRVYGGK
ncbi:nucleoside hydrolase [Gallalistipes aquisgranensis]|uniref:nucleoside hydrolase n=1 Tax=Gallalistipes aquisgranensis TaxID=2779358 RepID=UPI001CF85044|nr:nucleoside hydrolase [Gallalistipes aquisgranensis]